MSNPAQSNPMQKYKEYSINPTKTNNIFYTHIKINEQNRNILLINNNLISVSFFNYYLIKSIITCNSFHIINTFREV